MDTHVYHNDNFLNYILRHSLEGDTIRLVAVIPSKEENEKLLLEDAYQLTNNIDTAWIKNPSIRPIADPALPMRSTSVGDVMKVGDTYFVVEECGWRQLFEEELSKVTIV